MCNEILTMAQKPRPKAGVDALIYKRHLLYER
jgi:hypothetical protein